jgi:WD40 repeat protein
MSDVFISYSRKDQDFVRRLFDALAAQGRESWVDWEGIPPTADWLAEIYAAIEAADTFIFVVSPDSVESRVCHLEVAHAIAHHKRLVPVIRRDVGDASLDALAGEEWEEQARENWAELKRLNWLFFREGDDFDSEFQRLTAALDTDLEWVKAHTRLVQRGVEWESKGRARGFLLRGEDLDEAERWLAQGADKEPQPTALQTQYILASRQDATRRQRRTLVAALFGIVAVGAAAVIAFRQFVIAEGQRQIAEDERDTRATAESVALTQQWVAEDEAEQRATQQAVAETERDRAEEQARISLSRQLAAQARTHFDDRLDLAMLLAIEANNVADTTEAVGSLLDSLQHGSRVAAFLYGHTQAASGVAFSPDGSILASGSFDHTIILWDVSSGQSIREITAEEVGSIKDIAFSPDGSSLAVSGSYNTVVILDVETGQLIGRPLTGHTDWVPSMAFSPDGETLASGSADGTVILWDVADGQSIGEPLSIHTSTVFSVAFSPDGETVVSGGADGIVALWNVESHQLIGEPFNPGVDAVRSVAFSPDGGLLAVGGCYAEDYIICPEGGIFLWDVHTRQAVGETLAGHAGPVYDVAFSPDSHLLVSSAAWDDTIILWNVETGESADELVFGSTQSVYNVAFSPDGSMLAAAGCTEREIACPLGKITLWNMTDNQSSGASLSNYTASVYSIAVSPDGSTLALGGSGTITLWDMVNGYPVDELLTGHTSQVNNVAFSPNGRLLASSSCREMEGLLCAQSEILLWDIETRQPIGTPINYQDGWITDLEFSPDGQLLAVCGWGSTIIMWDTEMGQPVGDPLSAHSGSVYSIAFSPDGGILASGGGDTTIILWNIETGQPIVDPLTGHEGAISSVAFSPNGDTLVSGSYDDTLILWDVSHGQPIGGPLVGHTEFVESAAFSPDGNVLASGSCSEMVGGLCTRGEILLWDPSAGQLIGEPLTGHSSYVDELIFSPDGQLIISNAIDGTIILWNFGPEGWVDRACRVANRNLTQAEWDRYLGDSIPYRETCPDLP